MKSTIFFVFICAAVDGSGKHHSFPHKMTWFEAQAYCREHHTDLSFVSSEREQEMLQTAAGGRFRVGWIGLHQDAVKRSVWKWSGGGDSTYFNWAPDQPDDFKGIENVVILKSDGKWNDRRPSILLPFYCFSLTAVEVKKTWEGALEYCRETHTDLTTLQSDTEQLLTLSEIQHKRITDRVWIGLRFLGDHWLWVNGDPMVYENWRKGDQEHQCPLRKRCGALTKEGHWENWDCGEELHFICY
ncbi:macrophage mannose receptor 1-like [Labrus mixtus]|uniref:macrophage mannose receptor 1-like n=1 Tax=Labrus mixtus TaxID=508554 RepID=UPI0029C0D1C0|nr:macrophage mannose receptor 1-like [Labrus mixtus]